MRVNAVEADAAFLYQYLKSAKVREYFLSFKTGSAQPQLPIKNFSAIEIDLPDLPTQRRIASILSAYDDLIENSRRQIKLLEEAAQRLYKEWFVELRFPGHEGVKVVDGVPEGWMKGKLSQITKINTTNTKKYAAHKLIHYVDIGSVRSGHIESTTEYLYGDAPGRARRLAHDGDVIWGMVRPNLRPYALVQHPGDDMVFSTGFSILTATSVPFSYIYYLTTQNEFVDYLIGCTNGSAYPAVKPIHFENAIVTVPSQQLLNQYHSLVEPMLRKQYILSTENRNLVEVRDRLLPKLMNEEMEA